MTDRRWFDECMKKVLTHLREHEISEEMMETVKDEPYFVDFLRDVPEASGDEDETEEFDVPKVYEMVSGRSLTSPKSTRW